MSASSCVGALRAAGDHRIDALLPLCAGAPLRRDGLHRSGRRRRLSERPLSLPPPAARSPPGAPAAVRPHRSQFAFRSSPLKKAGLAGHLDKCTIRAVLLENARGLLVLRPLQKDDEFVDVHTGWECIVEPQPFGISGAIQAGHRTRSATGRLAIPGRDVLHPGMAEPGAGLSLPQQCLQRYSEALHHYQIGGTGDTLNLPHISRSDVQELPLGDVLRSSWPRKPRQRVRNGSVDWLSLRSTPHLFLTGLSEARFTGLGTGDCPRRHCVLRP